MICLSFPRRREPRRSSSGYVVALRGSSLFRLLASPFLLLRQKKGTKEKATRRRKRLTLKVKGNGTFFQEQMRKRILRAGG
jgi:hypothetical protein